MDLKSRLDKLKSPMQPMSSMAAIESKLSERLNRLAGHARAKERKKRASEEELAQFLGGTLISPGLIIVEKTLPLDAPHGSYSLGDILSCRLSALECASRVTAQDLLFVDTETTGLSGGTGTLPFLLGMLKIQEQSLKLCQLFLTQFSGENALLRYATTWLSPDSHVVTYNGKSFDIPLLIGRYRLARLAEPFGALAHTDLVYPTRRAFAKNWVDCRLQTAECNLLQFVRSDDLPGALIPEVWFNFLRKGKIEQLPGILEHNRLDLISLVALFVKLAHLYGNPEYPAVADADPLAVARHYLKIGEESVALNYLNDHRDRLDRHGLLELAGLYRARREWPEAVFIWGQLVQQGCMESVECLAKYYEHVARDHACAFELAQQLVERDTGNIQYWHRHARLTRKLAASV